MSSNIGSVCAAFWCLLFVFGAISGADHLLPSESPVVINSKGKFQPSPVDDFLHGEDTEIKVVAEDTNSDTEGSESHETGGSESNELEDKELNLTSIILAPSNRTEDATTLLVDSNKTISVAGSGFYGHLAIPGHHPPYPAHAPPHLPPEPHPLPRPSRRPISPSVVHRDPSAHFDHDDKIRTQDQDKGHQHYQVPSQSIGQFGQHETPTFGPEFGHHDPPKPYHYDVQVTPDCARKNLYYYNLTFCLDDIHYPTDTVAWALKQTGSFAQRLLADVTYQSADNLVDGLTKAEEEGYTYQHYFGGSHHQNDHLDKFKPPYDGYSYSSEYYKKGGYICPSNIYYARPLRAMNTYGKWKVIVNLDVIPKEYSTNYGLGHGHYKQETYTQTLRLEQCIYANAPCSYIDPRVHSRCTQKHNFHRLIAWTQEEGLHVDIFKMPVACSCHIKQPPDHPFFHVMHSNSHGLHLP